MNEDGGLTGKSWSVLRLCRKIASKDFGKLFDKTARHLAKNIDPSVAKLQVRTHLFIPAYIQELQFLTHLLIPTYAGEPP